MRFPSRCTIFSFRFLALCLVLNLVCGHGYAQKSAALPKPQSEVQALLDQANKAEDQYQWNEALLFLEAARQKSISIKDKAGEAATLSNIGTVYFRIGQTRKALEFYQQALPLKREVGDNAEAGMLNNIGLIYSRLGQPQKALEFYQQALPLEKAAGDRQGEAATLSGVGSVYFRIGQPQKALEFYQQALPIEIATGDKAGEAATLRNIGQVYFHIGQSQKALEFYQQALPLVREVGDRTGEAVTLSNIGTVYLRIGQLQKALEFYQQALPLKREVGDKAGEAATFNNIGTLYADTGQSQKALEFYQQALPLVREVEDRTGEATTLDNIGSVYSRIGQSQKALEFYQQALPLNREVGDRQGEAATLSGVGSVYFRIGQPQKALEFYQQALPIQRATGDKAEEAATLNSIGLVYSDTGQPQKALEFYQQALIIQRAIGNKRGEAIALSSIGLVYTETDQLQKALEFYQQALMLVKAGGDKAGEAAMLNNLGSDYSTLGQPQKALEFYQQALPIERATGDKAGEAGILNNLGSDYSTLGQPQKALEFYQQALMLERAIGNKRGEVGILNNIGFIYSTLSQPQKALEFYQQALPLYEDLYRQIADPKQIGIFQQENFRTFYDRYAVALWKRHRPEEAIAMLERGRGVGLVQLAALNRLPLQVLLGSDATVWQQANQQIAALDIQIREIAIQYRNARNPEANQIYAASLDDLRRQQQQDELDRSRLKQRLVVAHPDFARVFNQKPLTYASLRKTLLTPENTSTLYLEYAVVDDKTILLFVFSRSTSLHIFPLDTKILKQKSVVARVQEWREAFDGTITVPENSVSVEELSNLLLGPLYKSGLLAQHHYSHLVIVADGPLLDIPFAALMMPQGKRLIQEYALSTPFSLTMLTWPTPYRATSTSLLAVANPSTGQLSLRQAEQQARALLPLFPPAVPLFGTDATKANVLEKMGQCQILHFGLHGEANNVNGLASCLMLAAPKGADGRLTAAEITEHPLKAQLVVLSACETLQGANQGGEGLLGLAWAFRASGCPAVVASQWEVDEGATARLMKQFYAGLLPSKARKQGLSKDEALRQAMISVMRQPEYASPRSWAAFQVMGTTTPLHLISSTSAGRKVAIATGYRAE